MIKAEDSYEDSYINDLKGYIIHDDSDENYKENNEENEENPLLFSQNIKYYKKILKKYDKQTLMRIEVHQK